MKKSVSLLLVLAAWFIVFQGSASAQSSSGINPDLYHRDMKAFKISETVKIDGKLNDPVWRSVVFSGDFLQREPNEGAPATEETQVAILYDKNHLYIGVRCLDSEPDKIIATEMRRDAFLWQDDSFSIILDTFHDLRNAFYFTTNPAGVRRDGTVSDEGQIQNSNWDGVWTCKTSIDNKGWYVEIAIPWQTLRFKEGDNIIWGANFTRKIQRKNEDDYWRLIPRYAGRNGRYRMSEAGQIHGFDNLKMGGKFELKPFITGGAQHDESTVYETKTLKDAGLDLKINLNANLTADITYNTDFAQVEADQERVNLTRFSLFFPEKRGFFLEGAETFTFGKSGGGGFMPRAGNIQLFHSRRIGIEGRNRIPILGGTRLNGKVGKYTIGFMSILTEKTTYEEDEDEDEEDIEETGITLVPQTNFNIFRLKRNLFSRSSAGLMFLDKQAKDGSYNRSFGLDSNFPVNENLTFYILGAGTYSNSENSEIENPNKNNLAANAGFNWQSDLWEFRASILDIEQDFNPEMGFIRRTDIRLSQTGFQYSPRPEKWQAIRQFEFRINGQYQTDHQNHLLNRKIESEVQIRFENSASLSFNLENEFEYLDENWEIRDGFIIPMAGYDNTEFRLRYFSDRSQKIGGRINLNRSKYFTGTRTGGGIDLDIKTSPKFNANIDINYNLVKLPEGQFHTTAASARIIYSINPDFFIKAYLQWYDDKLQNEDKIRFSGNIILRYIYKPGSDFYLVFNQENLRGNGEDILTNRTVMAKMSYFLRK